MTLREFIKHFEKKEKIKLLPQQVAMLEMMDGQHAVVVMKNPRKIGINTVNKVWKEYEKQNKS